MSFSAIRPLVKSDVALFLVLLVVVAVAWSIRFDAARFDDPDAYDYAQMGAHLRRGEGFTTSQVFPRHVPFLEERGLLDETGRWPNLHRYPLPTIAHALFQAFVADPVHAGILQSGAWFLASLPALFLLARRLGGPVVALLGVALFAADGSFWASSTSGLTETLAIFLILVAANVVFLDERRRWKWGVLGGLCALAFLTRTQLWFLFPLACAFAWRRAARAQRTRALLATVLGFVTLFAPWGIRNALLTGDPLFSFSTSRNLVIGSVESESDLDLMLHAPVETTEVLELHGRDIGRKFLDQFWPELLNPVALVGSERYACLLVLILACRLFSRTRPDERDHAAFLALVVAAIALDFVTVSFAFPGIRFHQVLHPLVLVLALLEARQLFERRWTRARPAALVVAAVVTLASASACVADVRRVPPRGPRSPYERLPEITGADGVIASDLSFLIALHAGNPTVRLPSDPLELLELDEYLPLDFVHCSRPLLAGRRQRGFFGAYQGYAEFVESAPFLERFEPLTRLEDGSTLYRRR